MHLFPKYCHWQYKNKTKNCPKNSRLRPRARREPTQKRSIRRVCEHFKEVRNAAIGRKMHF